MRTPGHQLSYFILLATAISLQAICGQAITSHHICVDNIVAVSVKSTGLIHHIQSDSILSPCTLLLSGFVSGSYVYIPGVEVYSNRTDCGLSTNITINNAMYCVKGNQSSNTAIVNLTSDQLNITLPSADAQNFTLQYYNNIGVCGTIMELPNRAEVNQLSGVISTSYADPPEERTSCTVRLTGLPSPPVYVRFKLLYTTNLSYPLYIGDNNNFPSDSPVGSTLLVTTSDVDRSISVTYAIAKVSIKFVLTFSIVHCGDIPAIPSTAHTTTDTPWLPDANVTYECVDGWELKSDTESTIECKVDTSREIAVWSDHSNIQCIPVECELPAEYQNITNGNVTNKRYNYTQQLQYQCDGGYVRDVVVNCTKDGNWSALPSCVPAATKTSTSEWIGSSQSEINATITTTTAISVAKLMSARGLKKEHITIAGVGGLVVLAAVVVLVGYFCTHKTQSVKLQSYTGLTDSTAEGDGTENPYQDLEPPDVIPTTNNPSAGAYGMVALDDSNQYAEVSAPAARAKPTPLSNKPSSRPLEEPQGDVYAELKGKTALKAPKRHVPLFTFTEPVYDEAPALPAKLVEVVLEENTLYEGYGAAAQTTAQQAGNQSNVEMVDNTL